jgi:hypothetical protein
VSNDLQKITKEEELAKDVQIAKIEGDLQTERDYLNLERFIWIFVTIVLLDFIGFRDLSWFATFIIFILELIFVIIIGTMSGFHQIYTIVQNVLDLISRSKIGGAGQE